MLSPADIPLPMPRLIVLQLDPGKGAAYFHPFLYQNQVTALCLCELRDYMKESLNRALLGGRALSIILRPGYEAFVMGDFYISLPLAELAQGAD
jgi:hypothetical protein